MLASLVRIGGPPCPGATRLERLPTTSLPACLAPPAAPQLLSTKQMALLLVPHREHATDPEQICKMLLGGDGDEEASPSGVDFGHVLVDSGAV